MTTQGVARDDLASLNQRTSGQTIVCAGVYKVDPFTIKDFAGVRELPSVPGSYQPRRNDAALFLFDCNVSPPECKRVTMVPGNLVPLYTHLLKEYRSRVQTETADTDESFNLFQDEDGK